MRLDIVLLIENVVFIIDRLRLYKMDSPGNIISEELHIVFLVYNYKTIRTRRQPN